MLLFETVDFVQETVLSRKNEDYERFKHGTWYDRDDDNRASWNILKLIRNIINPEW